MRQSVEKYNEMKGVQKFKLIPKLPDENCEKEDSQKGVISNGRAD